jgi:hypothetical protein
VAGRKTSLSHLKKMSNVIQAFSWVLRAAFWDVVERRRAARVPHHPGLRMALGFPTFFSWPS